MNIGNLNIGTRLAIGFGAICAALVFMVFQATLMLGRINDGTGEIVKQRMPRIEAPTRMLSEVNDIAIALRNMMLNDDAADRVKQMEEITSSRKEIDGIFQKLDGMLQNPKARALLASQQAINGNFVKAQDKLLQMIAAGGDEAAAKAFLIKEVRPLLSQFKESINQQIDVQKAMAVDKANEAQATYESTRTLMIVLGLVILSGAALLARWITRSITQPVRQALDVANAVAAGDLTSQVAVTGSCEVSQLLQALNSMNRQLVATVSTVRSSTEAIATASSQVAAGNMDLSSRTEQQAGSLEETASSMEELTSTVKQNADNARQANTLADTASGVAARGGQVIQEVVQTMEQIHAASGKIVDIISVIDGIAFQTNILALNAAVEAARAGEQGRGFAVVAGEVRNLAQRSAAAAREIKGLIGDSSERVEAGSRLVKDAGATMEEIVTSVRHVADILNEISSASQEQSAGIQQVNEAVTQMDGATQQNAALVEEAAAASQSLQEQAGRLTEAVAVFKLAAHAGNVARVAAATSAAPAKRLAAPAPAAVARAAAKPAAKTAAKPATKAAAPAAVKPAAKAAATASAKPAMASRAPARDVVESDWEEF
jgi:methyl-accepting chemotaxis protein